MDRPYAVDLVKADARKVEEALNERAEAGWRLERIAQGMNVTHVLLVFRRD